MRIGIVSDTHDQVLAALHDALAGVDEILVCGNMDERALADRLPEEETLTRGGVRSALVHGHRVGRASVDDLAERFQDRGVDLVVWGHIHEPVSVER
jgi:predicted phosphodiesterase